MPFQFEKSGYLSRVPIYLQQYNSFGILTISNDAINVKTIDKFSCLTKFSQTTVQEGREKKGAYKMNYLEKFVLPPARYFSYINLGLVFTYLGIFTEF